MMKSVQGEKIQQTIELLLNSFRQKEQFMKEHVPIQEQVIKKIEQTAQLTLYAVANIDIVLRQQKNALASQCEAFQKAGLSNKQRFKLNDKKNPNQQFSEHDWNRNITRVLQGMSNAHIVRTISLKNYHKAFQLCLTQINKQQTRYRSQIKAAFKDLNTQFQNIDSYQKDQNKILAKLVKDVKNKEFKQSIHYLNEVKKAEGFLMQQFASFLDRNKKILELIKTVVKNQKKTSKKIKQILTQLLQKKKQLYKPSQQDQKIIGLLSVMEDGVQQSRQLYLQKRLVSKQLQQRFSRLVPPEKSRVHHLIKYFSIQLPQLQQKHPFFAQIQKMSSRLAFKNFEGVSLAQGWIITTFTPCIAYLTFDHYLAIFDMNGNLLKKIHSSSTKINNVNENNIVFLQETKKGFFSDSKQEYQLKFQNSDRMQQFILFIQNQIA